jgi:hypothetical protein
MAASAANSNMFIGANMILAKWFERRTPIKESKSH